MQVAADGQIRMSVYRAAVRKLDMTGSLLAHRGHGFFELFEAFANLECISCDKIVMRRPTPEFRPTSTEIHVTRRLPMRNDGIFFTIPIYEPCLPRGMDVKVSYELEFGEMSRTAAINFAQGHNDHSTVPPVLRREIHSITTDESHSASTWLRILHRRSKDGYGSPKRIILSQVDPVSVDEFKAFALEFGSEVEELRLGVNLTEASMSAHVFLETINWAMFKKLKLLRLALLLPPPPQAKKHFSTRPRLESTATVTSIAEEIFPPSPPTSAEDPASPTPIREPGHLGMKQRVARPVSALFKGIGAFAKGALGKEDLRYKLNAMEHLQTVDPSHVSLPGTELGHARVRTMSTPRPRPISSMDDYDYQTNIIAQAAQADDERAGAPEDPQGPSVPFPMDAHPAWISPPPDLTLKELHLNLVIHVPAWALYENDGDDWGYIRASVPHPAQLARELVRFGASCSARIQATTTEAIEGVDDISADYDLRVVGRLAKLFGRYGPFATDEERARYVDM